MNIHVISGKGQGRTLLSAFDAALKDCGVYNYNLIYLSSIIPLASHVMSTGRFPAQAEHYGHKAYVVKAEKRSDKVGIVIGAGLGWYQSDDGRGIFVEHHVQSSEKDENHVKELLESIIMQSIQDLCAFREIPFSQERMHSNVSIATVQNKPTCVLVLAVYHVEGWTAQSFSPITKSI